MRRSGHTQPAGYWAGDVAWSWCWSQWRETFDEFPAEIGEIVDVALTWPALLGGFGRGNARRVAVDVSQVDVYEVRDAKIVAATLAYPDKATALQALGLRE